MNRTRVKICGLRDPESVQACRQAGADAVGFVFYEPSVRSVSVPQAVQLASGLGPWQTPVALFVNPKQELVQQVVQGMPTVLLQFHGDESPEFCESFSRPYLKAIRVRESTALTSESARFASASGLLLDSWSEGFGGSGHAFDWSLLPDLTAFSQPVILSGGLNTENICQALSQTSPYGVDVSSGVECERGVKCCSKIVKFCEAVQGADFSRLQSGPA